MPYHARIHRIGPLLSFLFPAGVFAALMALPLLVLLLRGVEAGLAGYLTNPSVIDAVRLSLYTSAISLVVTLVLGTPLAYTLARWSFRYRPVVETFVDLPIVLPPMVAGIGLLLAFGRNGMLGGVLDAAGIRLPFTTAAVIFAQTLVSAPLYIRAARLGFGAIRPELIEAAYIDGCTEQGLFWGIMLPLAGRASLNGLILAWARAFGEFGATIIFAGNMQGTTQTMPLAIYLGFEVNLGTALALGLLLILISAAILFGLRRLESEVPINI
jgi:molybdate transport system permease protein